MNLFDEMLWKLNKEIKEKKIKQKDIAENLKLSLATISNTLNGKSGVVETLKNICEFVSKK